MRANKQMLLVRLGAINRQLGVEFWLHWDSCHKVWTLTSNKEMSCLIHTASTREMICFLDGILAGIAMKDGAYK